ncbi:venom serine protease 34-like [Leptopilina heterotoma]|uniref:venom serine protease 34-like n=1 Tax=Leptopilina heterotoma TaxID=63436 RepID=UPI001CA92A07|nr:venom serine protease 34-like [Leptopilina heterotoma]
MLIQQGARNSYNLGISLKLFYFSFIFLLLLEVSKTQDADCDFYQYIVPGANYYIYNPPYPNLSVGPKYCKFKAESPPDSRITLNCSDIAIPQSLLCVSQYLSINTNPSNPLNLPSRFCGYGSFDMQSVRNLMTVVFRILPRGVEARFLCTVTASYED